MNNGPQEVFRNKEDLEKCTTVKVKLESTSLPVLQCPLEQCSFTTHVEGTLRTHVLEHLRNRGKNRCNLRYYNCPNCAYFTTIQSLINEHISLIHRDADSRGEAEILVRWERFLPDQTDGEQADGGRVSPFPVSAPMETCSSNSSPPPIVSLESQYSRQVSSPSPSQQDLAIPLPNEGSGEVSGLNGDHSSPPPPPPFQHPSSTSNLLSSIALPNPNRPNSPPSAGGAPKKSGSPGESKPVANSSGGLHGSRKRKRAIPARCQQPAPESANVQLSNDDLSNLANWQAPGTAMLFMRQSASSGSPREASTFDEMDSVAPQSGTRTAADGLNNNLKLNIFSSLYSGNLSSSIRAMFSNPNSLDLNGFSATPVSQDQALDMSVRTSNGPSPSLKELNTNALDDKQSDAPLDATSLLLTATSGSADIQKVLSRLPIGQLADSVCVSVPCSPEQSEPSPPPDSRSGSEPPVNTKSSSNSSNGTGNASKPHRQNFTQQQNDILNRWYQRHSEKPYPSTEQTKELANECILSYSQVKKWFANKRARTSKGNRSANGGLNNNSSLGDATSPMDCTPAVSFSRSMLDLAQVVPPTCTSSPKMAPLAVSVDPLRSPGAASVGQSGGSGASVLSERFPFMLGGANTTAYQMQRLLQSSLASLGNPLTLASASAPTAISFANVKVDEDGTKDEVIKKETDRSDGEEIDEEEADKSFDRPIAAAVATQND